MAALIRETPEILCGTELETPTLTRWKRSTVLLLVFGVVVLADPIVFLLASGVSSEYTLVRRPSVLVAIPVLTSFWAWLVVLKAQRSTTSARMIGWAVLGAALNAGCIATTLAIAEDTTPMFGAFMLGLLAVMLTLPASVPVGLFVGTLLYWMHHWEWQLRETPTQDARVRWLSMAALWLGAVGVIGEVMNLAIVGYSWRSDAVTAFVWGPHMALIACALLSWIGIWRTYRLGRFLRAVESGKVRGLRLQEPEASNEVFTSGTPDGKLVLAGGEGAFRTASLELGTISRAAARVRLKQLCLLSFVALFVVAFMTTYPFDQVPEYPSRIGLW